MKKFIRNLSFRKKLLLIYWVCVIVPLVLVSVFFITTTIVKWNTKCYNDAKQDVNNARYSIQQLFDKALLNADYIQYNEVLYDYLLIKEGTPQQFLDIANKIDSMFQLYYINDTAQEIKIFSTNNLLYKSTVINKTEEMKKEPWYQEYQDSNKSIMFLDYYDTKNKEECISLIRKLDYRSNDNIVNILKLNLPKNQLKNALKIGTSVESLYLVDKNNKIVTVGDTGKSHSSIKYNLGDTVDINQKSVIYQHLEGVGDYAVIGLYSRRGMGTFDLEIGVFILIILISFLVSSFLIKIVDSSVTKRLNEITDCLEKLENEEFVLVNEYDALDEIGNLSRGMNSAVKKIQFLINEVYAEQIQKLEIEKEKDKAELRALMSQVNPHFMFNIFEIVRMKSLKKSISTMFRRLVHSGDDIILLNDELKYVFAYLNVCNYSMDNEINISLDIDEAALECKIPKMTIQVFVENAFIHGLENISENRKFFLKVKKLEYSLYICITDNGTGINAETIKAINEKRFKKNKNGRGVGIMNVLKRLSLYYGDDFKFSASSIPFKETKIEIEIPIKKE